MAQSEIDEYVFSLLCSMARYYGAEVQNAMPFQAADGAPDSTVAEVRYCLGVALDNYPAVSPQATALRRGGFSPRA
jgi:hypothetical protein